MRKNVISLLFVVFALCLGACGARQVRTGMPSTASLQASAASRETVVQATPAVSSTPAAAEPAVDVSPTPAAPPVVALRSDDQPRRPKSAAPRHVATAAPAAVPKPEIVLAASAASDPVPSQTPKDAATVASESMKMSLATFAPDAAAVAQSRQYWNMYLAGAAFAAVLGLLVGTLLALRRMRVSRLMRDAYKDLPDGTLLVQEIRGGEVSRTFMVMTEIQLKKASIDPALAESLEKQWFEQESSDAATVANDEEVIEPSVSLERPLPVMHIDPEPPAAPAATPEAPPAPAPGTVQISSHGLERHSVCGETDLKVEAPKDVDAPARTIIFEDHSAPSN